MALPIIGAAVIAFKSSFIAAIPLIVWRVVSALGLGYMLFSGFDVIFGQLFDFIFMRYNNLPVSLLQILDLMGLHKALNMLSATLSVIVIWKVAEKASVLRRKTFLMGN